MHNVPSHKLENIINAGNSEAEPTQAIIESTQPNARTFENKLFQKHECQCQNDHLLPIKIADANCGCSKFFSGNHAKIKVQWALSNQQAECCNELIPIFSHSMQGNELKTVRCISPHALRVGSARFIHDPSATLRSHFLDFLLQFGMGWPNAASGILHRAGSMMPHNVTLFILHRKKCKVATNSGLRLDELVTHNDVLHGHFA